MGNIFASKIFEAEMQIHEKADSVHDLTLVRAILCNSSVSVELKSSVVTLRSSNVVWVEPNSWSKLSQGKIQMIKFGLWWNPDAGYFVEVKTKLQNCVELNSMWQLKYR